MSSAKQSSYIEVVAVVEGKTEEIFIDLLLKPYLAKKNIYISATQVTKPGQKGGDVRFSRVLRDIEIHLKQRQDTYVTTMVDYYGLKEWPGLDKVPTNLSRQPAKIAKIVNDATKAQIVGYFSTQQAQRRFVPYISMHEIESLLFSDTSAIATELRVPKNEVDSILEECREPEAINNRPQTAPSKRLDSLSRNGKFPKITTGIEISKNIGISNMRKKCPLFNCWLATFEEIQKNLNETEI